MSEFKGTKGEWYDTFSISGKRGVRDKGGFICFIPRPTHYPGQDARYEEELDEYKRNAKLIAASPNLLESLQQCIKLLKLEGWTEKDGAIIQAEKAIKKATQ